MPTHEMVNHTIKHRLNVTKSELLRLLQGGKSARNVLNGTQARWQLSLCTMPDAEVHVTVAVPGGGDYSNTHLELDNSDQSIWLTWEESK